MTTAPIGIAAVHEHPVGMSLIRVSGELDLYSLDEFKEALRTAESEDVPVIVLDLRELGFIDSSGLGAIIGLQGRMQRAGRKLLVCPSDVVTKTFDVTGLYRVLRTVDTPEEALTA